MKCLINYWSFIIFFLINTYLLHRSHYQRMKCPLFFQYVTIHFAHQFNNIFVKKNFLINWKRLREFILIFFRQTDQVKSKQISWKTNCARTRVENCLSAIRINSNFDRRKNYLSMKGQIIEVQSLHPLPQHCFAEDRVS